jgi:predicted nucleic acid-binding protein
MQPALLDTSIYISSLREGNTSFASVQFGTGVTLWLSAVVLEELYTGARQPARSVIALLERRFAIAGRILVPDLSDWILTGNALADVASRHGYEAIARGRLTNDALIAMSAARAGITIITANARDFRRLAEFRSFHWQLAPL